MCRFGEAWGALSAGGRGRASGATCSWCGQAPTLYSPTESCCLLTGFPNPMGYGQGLLVKRNKATPQAFYSKSGFLVMQGGTQLKFIFNHASLLPCFLFFFLRKMDQASFPFSLSLSKTSEGYTTSILALPLEEKQFSFHRLQRQTRVRYTGPHLRVRHWWAPSQQEQQRRGRPSIGLLPDAPPTTVVMST